MEKLRIGIIGCGRIFPAHAQSIIRLDQAELVACCDTDAGALSAACNEYQVSGYSDYQEMLDKEALDAVHVCLPHYLHGEISRYALKKGVHVLCEKPMSITYEDALETVRVANEYKKMYGVIFQCRYNYARVRQKDVGRGQTWQSAFGKVGVDVDERCGILSFV